MDFSELFHQHKTVVFVVGGITVGAILYSFLHRGSSSSSSSPTTYNPSSGSTVSPTQYLVPYNAYFGGGGTPDSGTTSSSTTPSTGTPSSNIPANNPNQSNPPAASAPSAPKYGFGQKTINGEQYTLLGIESGNGPQNFSGYNVGGGAPVYFLAPGHQTPSQGTSQALSGAQVLVPSIYDPNISATANHPAHA